MICGNCGKENNENTTFCKYCGFTLSLLDENNNDKASIKNSLQDLTYYKMQEHLKGIEKQKQEQKNLELKQDIQKSIIKMIDKETKSIETNDILLWYFENKADIVILIYQDLVNNKKKYKQDYYGNIIGLSYPYKELDANYVYGLIDNMLYNYLKTFINEIKEYKKEQNRHIKQEKEKEKEDFNALVNNILLKSI